MIWPFKRFGGKFRVVYSPFRQRYTVQQNVGTRELSLSEEWTDLPGGRWPLGRSEAIAVAAERYKEFKKARREAKFQKAVEVVAE